MRKVPKGAVEKWLGTLQRRHDFLDARIKEADDRGQDKSFDKAERAALSWALRELSEQSTADGSGLYRTREAVAEQDHAEADGVLQVPVLRTDPSLPPEVEPVAVLHDVQQGNAPLCSRSYRGTFLS